MNFRSFDPWWATAEPQTSPGTCNRSLQHEANPARRRIRLAAPTSDSLPLPSSAVGEIVCAEYETAEGSSQDRSLNGCQGIYEDRSVNARRPARLGDLADLAMCQQRPAREGPRHPSRSARPLLPPIGGAPALNVSAYHPTTVGLDQGGNLIEPDLIPLLLGREQTDDHNVGAVERVIDVPVLLHADMISLAPPWHQWFPHC